VLICLHIHIKRAELLIHTLSLLFLSRTIPTQQVSVERSVGRVIRRAKRGTRVKACLITYITQIMINTSVSHIRSRQSHAPHSLNPNPRASALCSPPSLREPQPHKTFAWGVGRAYVETGAELSR
jgi:hypothetical protein